MAVAGSKRHKQWLLSKETMTVESKGGTQQQKQKRVRTKLKARESLE